jgi:hypothetical protein
MTAKTSQPWWAGKKELTSEEIEEFNTLFASVSSKINAVKKDDAKKKLSEDLIKHYLDLTKVLDQRRSQYFAASLNMLAISLAGLAIVLKYLDPVNTSVYILALLFSLFCGLIAIAVTGFIGIMTFYWQTKSDRYSFLKIKTTGTEGIKSLGNSWLWFYHGNPEVSKIPFLNKSNSENEFNGAKAYAQGAEFFFDKFVTATEEDILKENLKHAYLLLVHNAYKNKFDRQLTDRLSLGTKWTGRITLLIAILSIFYVNSCNLPEWIVNSKPTGQIVDSSSQSKAQNSLQLKDTLSSQKK